VNRNISICPSNVEWLVRTENCVGSVGCVIDNARTGNEQLDVRTIIDLEQTNGIGCLLQRHDRTTGVACMYVSEIGLRLEGT
jgi:hypothetical protein